MLDRVGNHLVQGGDGVIVDRVPGQGLRREVAGPGRRLRAAGQHKYGHHRSPPLQGVHRGQDVPLHAR